MDRLHIPPYIDVAHRYIYELPTTQSRYFMVAQNPQDSDSPYRRRSIGSFRHSDAEHPQKSFGRPPYPWYHFRSLTWSCSGDYGRYRSIIHHDVCFSRSKPHCCSYNGSIKKTQRSHHPADIRSHAGIYPQRGHLYIAIRLKRRESQDLL